MVSSEVENGVKYHTFLIFSLHLSVECPECLEIIGENARYTVHLVTKLCSHRRMFLQSFSNCELSRRNKSYRGTLYMGVSESLKDAKSINSVLTFCLNAS